MKVRELQEQLDKLDPELDILCFSESEDRVEVLDVLSVKELIATTTRDENGMVSIKFGENDLSNKL